MQSSNNYIRNNDSEINIESIISAPFIAISKANTMMLSGQARFILDYCFVKEKKDGEAPELSDFDENAIYKPVMINLLMQKSVVKQVDNPETGEWKEIIETSKAIISVPLLSIIPINSIAIDKVKVDFNLDITSITSYNNQSNGIIERKSQLNGKISSDRRSTGENGEKFESKNTSSRTLSVKIEAGALPLPLGILNILDLYSKNIHPTKIE
ncbi:hypothetical protein D3C87_370720 [compost metagenome]